MGDLAGEESSRAPRFQSMESGWVKRRAQALLAIASDQRDEYWTLEHFLAERPGKWSLSFCALCGDDVVAYVVASLPEPGTVHIHHFMVRADHRGRGLGRRMLAEAESRARGAGARVLGVKVRRDNDGAKRFYVRHGFGLVDEAPEYQPMTKALGPFAVAIHQPNYLPWLGYFHKIARADIFVFLDDVQFTKGGFTNRVQILSPKGPKWLTVPVTAHLGDPINQVSPSKAGWAGSHLGTLRGMYADAPCFKAAWPALRALLASAPASNLADINMRLVRHLAGRLGLTCRFLASSDLSLTAASDDRLVEIVSQVAPGGTYLSGRGAARYQDPAKFSEAGLGFAYLDFAPAPYPQGREGFVPGLSILDAVFHLGFEAAAALAAGSPP